MKERLSKSIKRLEKLDLIKKMEEDQYKELSAYEVKVFRQLRDKYDLSIEQNEISADQSRETELTEDAKLTLNKLKKVKTLLFKILIIIVFFPLKLFSNYIMLSSY